MANKEQAKLTRKRIEERLKQKKEYYEMLKKKLDDPNELTIAEMSKLITECESMSDSIDEFSSMLETELEQDTEKRKLEDKITTLENVVAHYEKIYGKLDL